MEVTTVQVTTVEVESLVENSTRTRAFVKAGSHQWPLGKVSVALCSRLQRSAKGKEVLNLRCVQGAAP